MTTREQPGKAQILKAVIDSVTAVAPDVSAIGADTHLLGAEAIVDSVGFITLLVELEQRLGNGVDLSTSLLEQEGVAEADDPFLTIGSLTDHIERLCSIRP